jgi:nucleoside 2-deoxyribosyltransferase
MLDKCPICELGMTPYQWVAGGTQPIECLICGEYRISERAAMDSFQGGLRDSHLYSGAIRELNERGIDVIVQDFDRLLDSIVVPSGPLERIDRIVLYIYRHTETDDVIVKLFDYDYPIAYAKRPSQFRFLIERANELGYVQSTRYDDENHCRLTTQGWKHVGELKKDEARTNQAFIAMSFDPTLRSVYLEGIKPALTQTGYVPLRVDEAQYNEKIDDRIIADIRKSGLVLADFTQHKAGVYFEAGFALGLGVPVIWICRESDIESTHFDTRQYNHIVWTNAQDLKEKLVARIEATVPLKERTLKVKA